MGTNAHKEANIQSENIDEKFKLCATIIVIETQRGLYGHKQKKPKEWKEKKYVRSITFPVRSSQMTIAKLKTSAL